MENIYPAYRAADVVVLASPVYYWSVSGLLKLAFDRLFAVAECHEDYANPVKETVLLMAAEGHGFDEAEYWYDHLERHMGWTRPRENPLRRRDAARRHRGPAGARRRPGPGRVPLMF